MNKLFQYTILPTLIFFMASCEGIVGGDGYIYDSTTKTPLKDVRVVLLLNDHRADSCYSDTLGFFRGSRFVGCVPNCPCAKIILTKDNFKPLTIDFNEYWKKNKYSPQLRDSMTIFLDHE